VVDEVFSTMPGRWRGALLARRNNGQGLTFTLSGLSKSPAAADELLGS
jgi:hypothetical protein